MKLPRLLPGRSNAERVLQQAFLADIARHQPALRRGANVRAAFVHAFVKVYGGEPTMAPAVIAGVTVAIGTALLMLSPHAVGTDLDPGPPPWAYALMTLGLLGFVVETAMSPQRLRPWRMALFFGLPGTVAAAVCVATLRMVVLSDQLFRAGLAVLAVGAALMVVLPLLRPRARVRVLPIAMRVAGVAVAATVPADAQWAFLEGRAHHAGLAWGCAVSAVGAVFLAAAYLCGRPVLD
jgi:hypothetical protein